MIAVVGGVYRERVIRTDWDEYFGSAGRAAEAIVELGGTVELYTYLDRPAKASLANRNREPRYDIHATDVESVASFRYAHGLSPPGIGWPSGAHDPIKVTTKHVVAYGMLKGEALIEAEYAVYDPQNVSEPKGFSANGSKAKHLAVVLNRSEAETLIGKSMQPEDLARALAEREQAEVVVLKCGPFGALVLHKGEFTTVPAYQTDAVFKVGSGDVFVAVFAHYWMGEQLSPRDAAERASRATAFYVQNKYPPSNEELAKFQPSPVTIGQGTRDRVNGKLHKVYLAGPFFTMGQFWVIEEAMRALISMGMNVLSPYHLVGPGDANEVAPKDLELLDESDVVLAIGDGMDAGTVFEVGYAKALGKPVIFYAENEVGEDIKMFEGTHCQMVKDFPTAIYKTVWEALAL